MIDKMPPVKKAKYKEITMPGKPKNNPNNKESFISPPPIPCFFVIA